MRHEYADLIHAWADGADIEYKQDGEWIAASSSMWLNYREYRIKPEKKPDVGTYIVLMSRDGVEVVASTSRLKQNVVSEAMLQLKIVRDSETGEPLTVEVVK